MMTSIKAKSIAIGSVLTILFTGFVGWLTISHEKSALEIELKERGNALVDNLSRNCEFGIVTLNKEELGRLAESTLAQKDIVFVRIEDNKGEALVTGEEQGGTEGPVIEFSAPVMGEQRSETREESMLGFGQELPKEQIGKVTIIASLRSLNRKIEETTRAVIKTAAVVLMLLVVVISLIVNTLIIAPIGRLIEATKRISAGDLSHKVYVSSNDEIGTLATFFNKMTLDLKTSKGKIEQQNKEIKESQERLIQSSKMAAVGQLAGGLAHELNNPMGVILGYAQALVQDMKQDDPNLMPLQAIEREAQRCKRLMEDLLTFSRVGKTTKEKVQLNAIIEQTMSLITAQAKMRNVKIVRNYAENLPQVEVNRTQIQQVIINLCNNAIDAMPKGGTLTITTGQVDRQARVEVSDTGQGMPPEVVKHIFEPFFTTKEVGKGTGLGLSLCYESIQKHYGNIEVASEAGKGTTFSITLPVQAKFDAKEIDSYLL